MTKEEIFETVQSIAADGWTLTQTKLAWTPAFKRPERGQSGRFEIMNELEDKFDIELDDDDAKAKQSAT